VHALEVVLLRARVVASPRTRARVVLAGLVQAPQTVAQERFALARRHRDLPLTLEEHGAQRPVDRVEVRRELVARHVGHEQPHTAADVVADGLRDHEAARVRHRADGDAAAAMEVGREHDALEAAGLVAPERRDPTGTLALPDGLDRALHGDEVQRLLDRFELDRNVTIREQGDRHPVRIGNVRTRLVHTLDERVQLGNRHGAPTPKTGDCTDDFSSAR
jgi:hypothetical protein